MTLEGMLGPNGRLDEAAGMHVEAPDALCVMPDGRLLLSSGARCAGAGQMGCEGRNLVRRSTGR